MHENSRQQACLRGVRPVRSVASFMFLSWCVIVRLLSAGDNAHMMPGDGAALAQVWAPVHAIRLQSPDFGCPIHISWLVSTAGFSAAVARDALVCRLSTSTVPVARPGSGVVSPDHSATHRTQIWGFSGIRSASCSGVPSLQRSHASCTYTTKCRALTSCCDVTNTTEVHPSARILPQLQQASAACCRSRRCSCSRWSQNLWEPCPFTPSL